MNIGIIGMGYVGKAVQASWLGSQHDVKFYDPSVAGTVSNLKQLCNDSIEAIFICVPTPSLTTGECDTSIVKEALDTILELYKGTIIVKSTVTPDFWKDYVRHVNVFHVPEFLVANNAIIDYLNPKFIFIGGNKDKIHDVVHILESSAINMNVPQYYTDLITASLVKYFMNTFLATKVTILNQFYQLTNLVGGDWHEFTEMIKLDARMGSSHNQVPGPDGQFGYGGACFPKDIRAIIQCINAHGVSAGVIEAVDIANTTFRGHHE